MFNVKEKVYVTHLQEVDIVHNRVVVIDPEYAATSYHTYVSDYNDPDAPGIVFKANSLEELISSEFGGSFVKFYSWLSKESKLYIAANDVDYARLFGQIREELQFVHNMSPTNLATLVDLQRLKEVFRGANNVEFYESTGPGSFSDIVSTEVASYKPSGLLYTQSVESLPLELVVALYQWNCIPKELTVQKIRSIAGQLLLAQIHGFCEDIKPLLAVKPEIISIYLGLPKDAITDIGGVITACVNDKLLNKLLLTDRPCSTIDLTDDDERNNIIRLGKLIIEYSLDYDADYPDTEMSEFQMLIDLYETQDIDILIRGKVSLSRMGMLASNNNKFNLATMLVE